MRKAAVGDSDSGPLSSCGTGRLSSRSMVNARDSLPGTSKLDGFTVDWKLLITVFETLNDACEFDPRTATLFPSVSVAGGLMCTVVELFSFSFATTRVSSQ